MLDNLNELLLKTKMVGDDEVNRRLKGIEKTGDVTAANVYKSLGNAFKGFMALAAVRQFTVWMRETINLGAEQGKSLDLLTASLKSTGVYTDDLMKRYKSFATEMQRLTATGDDVTLMGLKTLNVLTDLDEKGLQASIKSAIGLSKIFNMDLNSAINLVGKSIGGQTNALSRYGIQLDTTASQTEKVAQLTEQTKDMFTLAEAEAKTYTGAVTNMANAYGDWREEIGLTITQNETVITFIEQITDGFLGAAEDVSESSDSISVSISLMVIDIAKSLKELDLLFTRIGKGFAGIAEVSELAQMQELDVRNSARENIITRLREGKSVSGLDVQGLLPYGEKLSKSDLELLKTKGVQTEVHKKVIDLLDQEITKTDQLANRHEQAAKHYNEILKMPLSEKMAEWDARIAALYQTIGKKREIDVPPPIGGAGGVVPRAGGSGSKPAAPSNRYIPYNAAASRTAVENRLMGRTGVYDTDYPDVPLSPELQYMLTGESPGYIWANVNPAAAAGANVPPMTRMDALMIGLGVKQSKKIDTNDEYRAQMMGAIPGLITAGMEGGREFAGAALGLGSSMAATAIGGPWGMAAGMLINLIGGKLLNRGRREDPSEVVNVKVVNSQDIAEAALRVSSSMILRETGAGIDRMMYMRHTKLNVF